MDDAVLIAAAILYNGAKDRKGNTTNYPNEPEPDMASCVDEAAALAHLVDDVFSDDDDEDDLNDESEAPKPAKDAKPERAERTQVHGHAER